MEKERLIWADSLKGLLIILVILGHAIQSTLGNECFNNHLWNLIYSFHMPAFMAVSGWFAFRPIPNRGGVCNNYKKKVLSAFNSIYIMVVNFTINTRTI